jgi:hypothetical protein
MFGRLAFLVLAASYISTSALAQEDDVTVDFGAVWVTHEDCPAPESGVPGASPETAIDVEFDDPWLSSARWDDSYDADDTQTDADKYECRWVRLSGFMTWLDYYHYRGTLERGPFSAYASDGVSYIIENFVPGSPMRADLARRRITIVGRFYNLCPAAERAQKQAGASRWLFGPCHYGENEGMMLTDVRVAHVADATPQYIVGEANRQVMGSLVAATPAERSEVEPAVRAWAASLQKGLRPFADAHLAQYPNRADEDRQNTYDFIEAADGYLSYLLNQRAFDRLDLRSAQIEIFRPVDDDDAFRNAVGCVCLEASCSDRWPLTEADADNFLGPAACVTLTRWDGKTWNW